MAEPNRQGARRGEKTERETRTGESATAARSRGHSVGTRFDCVGVHCPDVMLRVDQGLRTEGND